MLDKPHVLSLSSTCLINSIKHEHSCKILYVQKTGELPVGNQHVHSVPTYFSQVGSAQPSDFHFCKSNEKLCRHEMYRSYLNDCLLKFYLYDKSYGSVLC